MRLGRVPLVCGALAVALTVLAMIPLLRPQGWSLTALVRVAKGEYVAGPARAADPGFRLLDGTGYDGQFYYGIARDPIARGHVHQLFDAPSYRYGHPLYGWLAWVTSGAGRPRAIPVALAALGLAAVFAAAVAAAVLGGWAGGLFVAVNPGLILAGAQDLTEPLAAALLLGGLLAYARDRRRAAVAAFVLLCFTKEPFVAVPVAIGAWELLRRRAGLRRALPLLLAPLPVLLWWLYLRVHLGSLPTDQKGNIFDTPLAGWKRALLDAGIQTYGQPTHQLAEANLALLVAIGGLVGVTALLALRLRNPAQAAFLPLAVVIATLTPGTVGFPKDLLRSVAVPLVLCPFVIGAAWNTRARVPDP